MAKLFDQMIEELKNATGGEEDEVIRALRAKSEEMGNDASEEDILSVMRECIASHLDAMISDEDEDEDDEDDEDIDEYMQECSAVIEEFLKDNDWTYNVNKILPELTVFELGMISKKVKLKLRIHLEAKPKSCRIEAILPISADATYEYPLCKTLAKINYRMRFGAFK